MSLGRPGAGHMAPVQERETNFLAVDFKVLILNFVLLLLHIPNDLDYGETDCSVLTI